MLIAAGVGIAGLQDYTPYIPDAKQIRITSAQGDTLDQLNLQIRDAANVLTLESESDILALDETDTHGWPTVNLLGNPSFETPYSGGIADDWNGASLPSGMTAFSTTSALYGSYAQVIQFTNVANSTVWELYQPVNLPTDEYGDSLIALPYFFSVYARTSTGGLVNVSVLIRIEWYASNGSLISDSAQPALVPTGSWARYSVSGTPPAGAASARVGIRFQTTSATNSGELLLDGAQFERAIFANTPVMQGVALTTALAADLYPTPYADGSQPGCRVETGRSNLAYRHLRLFGGFVKQLDFDQTASVETTMSVTGVEYGTLLQEAEETITFNQVLDTTGIAQAATQAQNMGYLVGLDVTTFVTSCGTIDAQSFAMGTFRDVLTEFANETGAAYWVDPYLCLHYGPPLANSAPFNLSDAPDLVTTYPYEQFIYTQDSTQTVTDPVIEGGDQTSAPQTYTGTGANTTLGTALTNGSPYTSLGVAALTLAVPQGTILTLVDGGNTQQVTTSQDAAVGAVSISVVSFTANFSYPATTTTIGIGTTFLVNGGNAINGVSSVVAAGITYGAGQIGLLTQDQLGSGGIEALYSPTDGSVQLLNAIRASQSVTVIYTYSAPVLVRVQASNSAAPTGPVRRKIFAHTKMSHIRSKKSAINRSKVDNAQYGKARPVVQCRVSTPRAPLGVPLTVGMAIQLTNGSRRLNQTLLQIIGITTTTPGNGIIYRNLQLGFYKPGIVIILSQMNRDNIRAGSNLDSSSVLSEVLSAQDGWALADSVHMTVNNVGKWGGPSTWDSATYVWG